MKDLIRFAVIVAASLAIVYGIYYIGKSISYAIFYEDMVQGTIREIVKMECLK